MKNSKEKFEEWEKDFQEGVLPEVSTMVGGGFINLHFKLCAIKELLLCAEYLNKDDEIKEDKSYTFWLIYGKIHIAQSGITSFVRFKDKETAEKAREILTDPLIIKAIA